MRQVRAQMLATLALLNLFVLVAGVVVADVIGSRPPAPTAYPAVLSKDTPPGAPDAAPVDPRRLADKLDGPMSDSGLGDGLSAYVADAKSGDSLYHKRADKAAVPASTTKLVTAVASLHTLGADTRISTDVVRAGGGDSKLILVGGGDPTLTRSLAKDDYPRSGTVRTLAERTADHLEGSGVDSVRLGYDDSLYRGPDTGPGWKPNYVDEGSVAPVHSLALDGGYENDSPISGPVTDPPRTAAEAFASELREAGIDVTGDPEPAKAPNDPDRVAAVKSAPVSSLVERMLEESDNNIAEALAHQVAAAKGQEVSFTGYGKVIGGVMSELGVDNVDVKDGSGLSVKNRITPKALTRLLRLASDPDHPNLHFVLSGLPTAHFTGTLDGRYGRGDQPTDGAGTVRAKTGTLSGVSTLAGTVYDADGRLLVFGFMVNDDAASPDTLDTLAAELAKCGCS